MEVIDTDTAMVHVVRSALVRVPRRRYGLSAQMYVDLAWGIISSLLVIMVRCKSPLSSATTICGKLVLVIYIESLARST